MISLPESVLTVETDEKVQTMNAASALTPRLAGLSAGVLAAFASIYFVWGTTYLGIAVAIQTLPPFFSGAARFLIAGA
jgi:hypothetical protein